MQIALDLAERSTKGLKCCSKTKWKYLGNYSNIYSEYYSKRRMKNIWKMEWNAMKNQLRVHLEVNPNRSKYDPKQASTFDLRFYAKWPNVASRMDPEYMHSSGKWTWSILECSNKMDQQRRGCKMAKCLSRGAWAVQILKFGSRKTARARPQSSTKVALKFHPSSVRSTRTLDQGTQLDLSNARAQLKAALEQIEDHSILIPSNLSPTHFDPNTFILLNLTRTSSKWKYILEEASHQLLKSSLQK